MSDERASFFSRWSQRKAQARTAPVPAEPPALPAGPPEVEAPPAAAARTAAAPPVTEEAATPGLRAPTLADVAELSHASDYSRFVAPGVDSNVRNAAMKKLFTDPHFNIMDGLDIYIDDYGKPDPIPPEMLRQMVQSKVLGLFEEEEKAEAQAAALADDADARREASAAEAASGQGATVEPLAAEAPTTGPTDVSGAGHAAGRQPARGFVAAAPPGGAADNPPHDDDASLQLQPDDAAGHPGADQGARPRQV